MTEEEILRLKPLTKMEQNEQIEYAQRIVDTCSFPLTVNEKVDMINAMVVSVAKMKIMSRTKKKPFRL